MWLHTTTNKKDRLRLSLFLSSFSFYKTQSSNMVVEYAVKLDKDVVPTTETKIVLANTLKVPPLGK
jgi:hypothetical protein